MSHLTKEQVEKIILRAVDARYKHIRVSIEADGRTSIRIDQPEQTPEAEDESP